MTDIIWRQSGPASDLQRRRIHFQGFVLHWLNKNPQGAPAKRRVRQLLEQLRQLDSFAKLFKSDPENSDVYSRWHSIGKKINKYLKRFASEQQVLLFPSGAGNVRFTWELPDKATIDDYEEFDMVLRLINAKREGLISSVRECNCGALYLGRTSTTRFCSEECRVAFWEQSEERKAQKRTKAREYYRLHKSGKVK